LERMMGFEPTTFCMASRRSSRLSYIRTPGQYSPALALRIPPRVLPSSSARLRGRFPQRREVHSPGRALPAARHPLRARAGRARRLVRVPARGRKPVCDAPPGRPRPHGPSRRSAGSLPPQGAALSSSRDAVVLHPHGQAEGVSRPRLPGRQAQDDRDRHPRLRAARLQRPQLRDADVQQSIRHEPRDHGGLAGVCARLRALPSELVTRTRRARAGDEQLLAARAERLRGGTALGQGDGRSRALSPAPPLDSTRARCRRRRRRAG
jgi:hypothetical protein